MLKEADEAHARLIGAVASEAKSSKTSSKKSESDSRGSTKDSSDDESESDSEDEYETLDCFTTGKSISLSAFYRLARNTTAQWLPDPNGLEVDERYWSIVTEGTRHVCVHEASLDTSEHGYGFTSPKNSPSAKHPWNLKNLCQSSSTILRSMGNVIGVTSPTLHVGMLFSSVCWYRDPHSLPWIEYLHSGASKIWYGVASSAEEKLREAMSELVPEFVKDSPIWLPSDTTMVDPTSLSESGVPVCRVVQEPGQFVLVFPGAFTASLCTGYLIAESAFFARHHYFERAEKCFALLAKCREPAMFSLERLVVCVAGDARASVETLTKARPLLANIVSKHSKLWQQLQELGVLKALDSKDGAMYCLEHALELATNCPSAVEHCTLLYRYTVGELKALEKQMDDKLHQHQRGVRRHVAGAAAAKHLKQQPSMDTAVASATDVIGP
ncbi:hypothetical protein HAZT_HAZT007959 [Hyalella azteca]|uniref:JmjC domain-containing protein n=1 Tax=Hyalella azteca TaxID=294128 RepID=A0A6A0HCR1_HYAAZ|nr:hypothetical protein HAZT_HAZT007959 [Hyalella azteca]